MRKTILYIAMSLDGYIADKNGKVDWLIGQDQNAEIVDTYSQFIKRIDTVIMGWNTYHQIITELSINKWIYDTLISYVITHHDCSSQNDMIYFVNKNPNELVKELKEKDGKDIWICGGANIVQQLIEEDHIDEYHITIIPTILGKGIHLFNKSFKELRLTLKTIEHYNGIVELVYERNQNVY